jgi:hypothetical protein
MQRKDLGRRIASGVTAKLEFDYTCERGNSFSEYYLHGVINEIIAALTSPTAYRIHTGYAHLALRQNEEISRGRPRELDFFVEPYQKEEGAACLEVKWAASSHCRWDNVLLDLFRLALVKRNQPTTECLFVMSGPTDDVLRTLDDLRTRTMRPNRGKQLGALQIPDASTPSSMVGYRAFDWAGRFSAGEGIAAHLPRTVRGRVDVPLKMYTTLAGSHTSASGMWMTATWRLTTSSSVR